MSNTEETYSWLDELNPQQRNAVTHGDGPLLVVAGAGTGKTKTLAYRVAYLISQGMDPGRILLLTFTRRSAQEMLRRHRPGVGRYIPCHRQPSTSNLSQSCRLAAGFHGDGSR